MPRGPKNPKTTGVLRFVLASNVAAMLPIVFHAAKNKTAREKQLALAAGVSASTVQRIIGAETGASLDNIEHIARALGVSVIQLLTPSEETQRMLNIQKRQ